MFRVTLHLYLYLCPARSPTFPRLQKPGCLCPGHPHSVPLPFLIPSDVSQLPSTFCVVLHGFAITEEVETQQSLKLVPRGQTDGKYNRQDRQRREGKQWSSRLHGVLLVGESQSLAASHIVLRRVGKFSFPDTVLGIKQKTSYLPSPTAAANY